MIQAIPSSRGLIYDRNGLELVTNVGVIRSLRHHKHLFSTLPAAVEHARSLGLLAFAYTHIVTLPQEGKP